MKKTVFISGATSGIGEACAYLFAENQWNLIVTGRRSDRLDALKEALTQLGAQVLTQTLDHRNKQEVFSFIENLPTEFQTVDLLINNAGLARGFDEFHQAQTNDWDEMIDTNIKGLLYTAQAISKLMVASGAGHIINVASLAGKEVYPKGHVYCATKHAVEAITKGMRQDLLPYGIKVSQISPGLVQTEFSQVRFYGDQQRADKVYEGFETLVAQDIAELIYFMASRAKHLNIQDLLITPSAQATSTQVLRS